MAFWWCCRANCAAPPRCCARAALRRAPALLEGEEPLAALAAICVTAALLPWFFISGVLFNLQSLPGLTAHHWVEPLLRWANPIAPFIEAMREILYDGLPLQALEYRSLRRQFGVVLQEPSLFDASIRRNIAFFDPDLPSDEVVADSWFWF